MAIAEIQFEITFDLRPDCGLDLECGDINLVHYPPSHYVLSICELPSKLGAPVAQWVKRWPTDLAGRV